MIRLFAATTNGMATSIQLATWDDAILMLANWLSEPDHKIVDVEISDLDFAHFDDQAP